ncbi:MAG: hypothetical protein R3E79_58385 [Caldilineaceae bacterium]
MQRFSYTPHPQFPVGMPLIEIKLAHASYRVVATALVDSGAALNILPFDLGLQLGLDWKRQNFPLDLGGTLAGAQAYAVLLKVALAPFPPVDLAFAWVSRPAHEVRLLLGQVNFFQVFDVHFYGAQQMFEIDLR